MMVNRTAVVCLAALLAAPAAAENWPQWRGPNFNGSCPATNLPGKWTRSENVTWSAKLGGGGGSTPVVWGDCVFITAMERSKGLWAICVDRTSGEIKWRHGMGKGWSNRQGNTAASPSAITDGKQVFFYFGTGVLTAYDMAGRRLWQRDIQKDHGKFGLLWDYASTPLLWEGKLYVPVIHSGGGKGGGRGRRRRGSGSKTTTQSYLLCVDPGTGKDVWKRPRPTDAPGEARDAYVTPYPMTVSGTTRILLTGGDYVTAHDPASGRIVWRAGYNPRKDKNYRTVVSAVSLGGMIIVPAPRGGPMYCFEVGRTPPAWVHRQNSPDVCTPLAYKGRFYVLDGRRGMLLCIEPKSGKLHSRVKLPGRPPYQASPTGADDKIYCINLSGQVVVLSADETPKVLHQAEMGGRGCRGSISVSDGQLFIRADDMLYCVGKRNG